MCGHDWCSVRISKEIQEWASGKAHGFSRGGDGKPKRSDALTPEQQEILRQRGNLSPEEIHKLASKTRKAVGAGKVVEGKASCHSDFVDPEAAKQQLVSLGLGPKTSESMI